MTELTRHCVSKATQKHIAWQPIKWHRWHGRQPVKAMQWLRSSESTRTQLCGSHPLDGPRSLCRTARSDAKPAHHCTLKARSCCAEWPNTTLAPVHPLQALQPTSKWYETHATSAPRSAHPPIRGNVPSASDVSKCWTHGRG